MEEALDLSFDRLLMMMMMIIVICNNNNDAVINNKYGRFQNLIFLLKFTRISSNFVDNLGTRPQKCWPALACTLPRLDEDCFLPNPLQFILR